MPFASNIFIEDPFFVTSYDIFEKRVISLRKKKSCLYRYAIFFILFTKTMTKLAHFSYFLKVTIDCRMECVEVKCKFLSTFARIAFF